MATGVLLVPSSARVASGTLAIGGEGEGAATFPQTAPAVVDIGLWSAVNFELAVTAASTLVGDTMNLFVQHSVDGGTNFDDFVSFTQVLGNGGAKTFYAQWVRDVTPTTPQHIKSDGSLAAGVLQGPVGDQWRAKWVVAGTGSFTFSLQARVVRRKR